MSKFLKNFKPGLSLVRPKRPLLFGANGLAAAEQQVVTPVGLDLRTQMLESNTQGYTNYCASYALAGMIEFLRWKLTGFPVQIDPNPIAHRADEIDGIRDDGTTLEAAVQAAQDLGLIDKVESEKIEIVTSFVEAQRYMHKYNMPILSAFQIDQGWGSPDANAWISPRGGILGGHAVLTVAYSLNSKKEPPWIGIQNSWGKTYGWNGFARMSPESFEQWFCFGLVWNLTIST